jgi:hypothetical protein
MNEPSIASAHSAKAGVRQLVTISRVIHSLQSPGKPLPLAICTA